MDRQSSIDHERLYEEESQSGRRKAYFYTPRTEWIPFGLLALLFVLLLVLFIIVFSGVHNLSSDMDKLHTSIKKKTCEVGWKQFDESCYFLTKVETSWAKIRNTCLNKGADLAVITSDREQIFLTTFSDAAYNKWYWIGLHDMDEEGSWIWVDGTDYETSYKYWKEGEPNDYKENEDCVHLLSFGHWNDASCDSEIAYGICEKKL
ncbi:hepatic lectin-like isoform X2 [Hyla sarda]|uniref:hepatic lectin-like isoform X2 n=1 Tax=Hyla sarda TaxID=327740 RepID=UPI0024C3C4D0|nr:hepatic lectin-like isoform X2 [Hyla sarda]